MTGRFELFVDDREVAAAFYVGVLGFTALTPTAAGRISAHRDHAGCSLGLEIAVINPGSAPSSTPGNLS